MTICIGALNLNGSSVVVASDSMITNNYLSIEFEHPITKMTRLSDTCIALTAGDALAHTELFNDVRRNIDQLRHPTTENIKETVKSSYQLMRQKTIAELYLMPGGFGDIHEFYQNNRHMNHDIVMGIQGQMDSYDYGLEILLAGVSNGKASIYGILNPGTSHCFDSIGFYAIGSGLPHALNSLIARECYQGNTLEESLLNVYESKIMAEKAPGVGSNVTNICIIEKDGITMLTKENIADLKESMIKRDKREDSWKEDVSKIIEESKNGNKKQE